jgi:hypothetical protein
VEEATELINAFNANTQTFAPQRDSEEWARQAANCNMSNGNEAESDSDSESEETAYQRGIDEIEMQFIICTTERQSVHDLIAERLQIYKDNTGRMRIFNTNLPDTAQIPHEWLCSSKWPGPIR